MLQMNMHKPMLRLMLKLMHKPSPMHKDKLNNNNNLKERKILIYGIM
jgi:hypothetical protein